MTWNGKGEKEAPARKRGALIEQSRPLSLEDLRLIYRRRVRDTAIIEGQVRAGGELTILDRMLTTIFWLVEKRELPKGQSLTGKEWEL